MEKPIVQLEPQQVQQMIHVIRGEQVMVDADLAELYRILTKRLNEQVKRNIERSPEHFRFPLTDAEREEVVANCDHLKDLRHMIDF